MICYRNMNSDRNGWDSTKRVQMSYFHCGPSTKTRKHTKIYLKYI